LDVIPSFLFSGKSSEYSTLSDTSSKDLDDILKSTATVIKNNQTLC
jgi:hypothetical protein